MDLVQVPERLALARSRAAGESADANEAILRRSLAVGGLAFQAENLERLRERGVRVKAMVAEDDQLLDWPVQRLLLEALGIPAPESRPKAGARLSDPSGLFEAVFVAGDHYLPMKDPVAVSGLMK